ncbi:sigma factor G inhibitor Gin [Sporolactobacillus terrae]|uniref:Sigma factor G inhibitor Gin n=1 Tax=Sporolactobacillus terrae TaxID=269673 RepID=A0A410D525_9BACL|nr:sigma factor G inhibitor Gin [Sporolactobacillus terrae]QAA21193.1 hypothetical protein C0674_00215 [Sporolactobacillus terrae]QAA24166.1 hypothetical protein C0679_00195 [Sporolactobacillus terrae]BBN97330.1 hypothetical protein St703_00350 [Sporolactobacillus terrae]
MALKEQTQEVCLVCGRHKTEGIHIFNQLICNSCQKKIVETDVTDWKYKYYMDKLAKLRIGKCKKGLETAVVHAGTGGEAEKQ